MAGITVRWRSEDGQNNATALQVQYAAAFDAVAEVDALGHRVLHRVSGDKITDVDRLVGVATIRRAVTLFVGIRHLLEASAIEPCKLVIRAQFETLLAFRYLVHGGKRVVGLQTKSDARKRESRARYFMVAAARQLIYSRQSLLDGRWGERRVLPADRKSLKKRLKAEIVTETARLRTQYPAQTKAFGPYRCYPARGRAVYHDFLEWYSFGFRKKNVKTVRALAAHLGWAAEYEMLYASFSGMMHPRGISHDGKVTDGGFEVYHPYTPEAFDLLTRWACAWQMLFLAVAMHSYSPESTPDVQAIRDKIAPALDALSARIPDGLF